MTNELWYWLRLSRSAPFGEAGRDQDRSILYRAALQQFEDLMRAAAATGPSSRPLPLFYALSQAGRAIVAALGGADHKSHGLTIGAPQEDLLRTVLRPVSRRVPGQFQTVSAAVGSAALDKPVQLGALMASLPELSDELLIADAWPRALSVWPLDEPFDHIRSAEWLQVRVVFDEGVRTGEDVRRVLPAYPAAKENAGLVQADEMFPQLPRTPTPGGSGVRLLWRDEGAGIDSVFPQYRFIGRRWLRPGVIHGSEPPTPIMTWWGLLFGLSMLARYHPGPWVRSLDPDSSPIAVALERSLDLALETVPHLVYEALCGQPILFP